MIIIGEKINGSIPEVARAIEEKNAAWIQTLVKKQINAMPSKDYFDEPAPCYLDLCAACDPKKELDVMKWLIEQTETALSDCTANVGICLDSPNPQVLIQCKNECSRPGILNSASLEMTNSRQAKAELLFSEIQGTSWGCIALLFSHRITRNFEERIQLFHKLYELSNSYCLDPGQLYIDPISEAVSIEPDNFLLFEQCCQYIHNFDKRLHIVSGAANISYGLPKIRMPLNAAFLTLGIHAGMDCAILDPCQPDLISAIYAAELLSGKSDTSIEYIHAHRQGLF